VLTVETAQGVNRVPSVLITQGVNRALTGF